MAFVPGIGQVKTTIEMQTGATAWSFGLWTSNGTPADTLALVGINTVIGSWLQSELMQWFPPAVTLNGLVSYAQDSTIAPKVGYTYPVSIPGTDSGTPVSVNTCMVVTLDSGERGRGARGRVYLTGFRESYLGERLWDGSITGAIDAAFIELRTALLANNTPLIVSNKQVNSQPLLTRTFRTVSTVEAKAVVGSQRDRVDYGDGRN